MNNFKNKTRTELLKINNIKLLYFTLPWTVLVFVRLLFVSEPFSFDYPAYIFIIDNLTELSFLEILRDNLMFPYVVTEKFTPVEFGFVFLVKITSLLGFQPHVIFALIASLSVGLRVYTMKSLGVPTVWILWINIFAVTLFEANALRLGVASSFLIFGMRQLFWSRLNSGFILIIISFSIHLQTMLFAVPFIMVFLFSNWTARSKPLSLLVFAAIIAGTIFSLQLIPFIENEKVQEYTLRGTSGSAGITVTSIMATIFVIAAAILKNGNNNRFDDSRFYFAIILASIPSLLSLLLLTNVAVIGDRAWQLAYLILSTFFFLRWTDNGSKKIILFILLILSLVMQINILIRYPLSEFFSPPLPTISY